MLLDKIRYRLVYNRKNKLNQQGEALIQIEASQYGAKAYFSTNIYIRPEHWDKKTSQVCNHPQAKELNAMLYENIIKMQQIEIDRWKNGQDCNLFQLKEIIKRKSESCNDFFSFSLNIINESQRKQTTKDNIITTIKILRLFRHHLYFKDITYQLLKDFERYLIKRGNHINTINKHMRNIRTLVNEAINYGYIKINDYPFRKYKMKHIKTSSEYLTWEDIHLISNLNLESQLDKVRNAFIFCCYTGLRFSDFISLKKNHIVMSDNEVWIKKSMKKTGIIVNIPLSIIFNGEAVKLLNLNDIDNFTNIGSNTNVNRNLSKIIKKAGIAKHVTFHTARHTCATLLISNGVPITTVQKILGHTSVKTTQIYFEVTNNTIVNDLKCK